MTGLSDSPQASFERNSDVVSDFGLGIAERLLGLKGDDSLSAFARRVEVPLSSLRQYLAGSIPGADKAAQIAEKTGSSLAWLITGNAETLTQIQQITSSNAELTMIPRYDVRASSGTGNVVQAEDIFEHLAFRTDWLRSLGIAPQNASLLQNEGDSNEPTIPDGALMLCDRGIDRVANGFFYALQRDGELLIKRIQQRMDGSVLLISDNPRYEREEIHVDRVPELNVIGRIKWIARSI